MGEGTAPERKKESGKLYRCLVQTFVDTTEHARNGLSIDCGGAKDETWFGYQRAERKITLSRGGIIKTSK